MDRYNTRHLMKIFKISSTTVRKYANKYEKYLSHDAKKKGGGHRTFSPDDLKVFTTIAVMKSEGTSWDEIEIFLDSGQRYEPPEFDDKSLAIMTSGAGDDLLERLESIESRLMELEETKEARLLTEIEKLRTELKESYLTIGRLQGKHNDTD